MIFFSNSYLSALRLIFLMWVRHVKNIQYSIVQSSFFQTSFLSVCILLSDFLSAVFEDDHRLYFKYINIGVLQNPVLSTTPFLLFTNDLLSVTFSLIQSYTGDSSPHCSFHFEKRLMQLKRVDAKKVDFLMAFNLQCLKSSISSSSNLIYSFTKLHLRNMQINISISRNIS